MSNCIAMIFGDDEKMACPVVLLCALGGWWDCVVISSSKCLLHEDRQLHFSACVLQGGG